MTLLTRPGLLPATFQVTIATAGTAVQVAPGLNYIMQNGATLTANATNNPLGGTYGYSSAVTNGVTAGTGGNGKVVYPGGSDGIGGGVNVGTIWVNGSAGDSFSLGES